MDKIVSINEGFGSKNTGDVLREISARVRGRRLELNLSQSALSKRSGVSLGTLKRFERAGEISLKHLIMLAAALDCARDFDSLFSRRMYRTFEEAVAPVVKEKKRGRIND
ncbi:MAG TPA: XRE family transcriptional regulator [bacterium]|nr:XRE family transcriptional regulator [bacterium]